MGIIAQPPNIMHPARVIRIIPGGVRRPVKVKKSQMNNYSTCIEWAGYRPKNSIIFEYLSNPHLTEI